MGYGESKTQSRPVVLTLGAFSRNEDGVYCPEILIGLEYGLDMRIFKSSQMTLIYIHGSESLL